jgi:hypothetical protein
VRSYFPPSTSSGLTLFTITVHNLFWWKVSKDYLHTHDWAAELDVDLFPKTDALVSPVKPKQIGKRTRTAASLITKKQKQKQFFASTVPDGSDILDDTPSPKRRKHTLLPPVSTSNRPSAPPASASPQLDVPNPSALSAFLSSFAPSHNFSSTSLTLHLAGLSSMNILASLLPAEQGTHERAIKRIVEQGKMSEKEGRWVSFAMGEAKREWERQ